MSMSATGRAWVFGDEVNTDDMYPAFAMRLPMAEAATHMFNASRPGWPALVRPGDIVVGGRNFGLGSSRPVPMLFKELGIAGLVAEQFNSLFYRNCINYGLLALTVPDARELITEGDQVCLDIEAGRLVNETTAPPPRPYRSPGSCAKSSPRAASSPSSKLTAGCARPPNTERHTRSGRYPDEH